MFNSLLNNLFEFSIEICCGNKLNKSTNKVFIFTQNGTLFLYNLKISECERLFGVLIIQEMKDKN